MRSVFLASVLLFALLLCAESESTHIELDATGNLQIKSQVGMKILLNGEDLYTKLDKLHLDMFPYIPAVYPELTAPTPAFNLSLFQDAAGHLHLNSRGRALFLNGKDISGQISGLAFRINTTAYLPVLSPTAPKPSARIFMDTPGNLHISTANGACLFINGMCLDSMVAASKVLLSCTCPKPYFTCAKKCCDVNMDCSCDQNCAGPVTCSIKGPCRG
jgi:hypothetical protein